jgi:hypothetical protein
MKPIHLLLIAVAGFAAWYFLSHRSDVNPGTLTQNTTGGIQTAAPADPFNSILSAVKAAFDAAKAIAQTSPKTT